MKKIFRLHSRFVQGVHHGASRFILDMILKAILAILAGYFALAFNEPEGFADLLVLEGFKLLWGINAAICFVLLVFIQLGEWLLNRYVPWKQRWLRIPLQVVVCLLCPIALAFLAAKGYFAYFQVTLADTSYFNNIFYLVIILVIVGNAYQLIWHLLFITRKQQALLASSGLPDKKMEIRARLAKQYVSLSERECAYLMREGKDLAVFTMDNRKYYIYEETAIKDWEPRLDEGLFCRINAGCIVNRHAIDKSTRYGARSFHLTLKPPLEEQLIVSQSCFNAYKRWMGL